VSFRGRTAGWASGFPQRQSAALASAVCVSLRIASAVHPSDTGVRRDEGDSKLQDRLLTPVFGCLSLMSRPTWVTVPVVCIAGSCK
jgi:hypothetical protein